MRETWRVAWGEKARRRCCGLSDRSRATSARACVPQSLLQGCRRLSHGGATELREGSFFDGGARVQGIARIVGRLRQRVPRQRSMPEGPRRNAARLRPRAQESVTRPTGGGRPNPWEDETQRSQNPLHCNDSVSFLRHLRRVQAAAGTPVRGPILDVPGLPGSYARATRSSAAPRLGLPGD
jgi:hypothetical protein